MFSVVDIPADESKVEEVGAGEGETEILLFKAGGLEEGYKRVGVAGNTICCLVSLKGLLGVLAICGCVRSPVGFL